MYSNTKARVVTPDRETELFDNTAGVLQGDTLAPFFFVLVLDYAMRRAMGGKKEDLGFTLTPRKSRRHLKEIMAVLEFADDIALLSDAIEEAQDHSIWFYLRLMQEGRTKWPHPLVVTHNK